MIQSFSVRPLLRPFEPAITLANKITLHIDESGIPLFKNTAIIDKRLSKEVNAEKVANVEKEKEANAEKEAKEANAAAEVIIHRQKPLKSQKPEPFLLELLPSLSTFLEQFPKHFRGALVLNANTTKTVVDIAIAESFRDHRPLTIITLQKEWVTNQLISFFNEMCLESNRFAWEFLSTEGYPELLPFLETFLGFQKEYWQDHKGIYLPKANKDQSEWIHKKDEIILQIETMIRAKFHVISFEELLANTLSTLFDNRIVVIDEIERMVQIIRSHHIHNKIIYNNMINAPFCRIVGVSCFPLYQELDEWNVLFNILQGNIYRYAFSFIAKKDKRQSLRRSQSLQRLLGNDILEIDPIAKELHLTRNPFVQSDDDDYEESQLITRLQKEGWQQVQSIPAKHSFLLFPEDRDLFRQTFLQSNDSFFARIRCLTSCLPFVSTKDERVSIMESVCTMSAFQEKAYRLHSRDNSSSSDLQLQAACQFSLPDEIVFFSKRDFKNRKEDTQKGLFTVIDDPAYETLIDKTLNRIATSKAMKELELYSCKWNRLLENLGSSGMHVVLHDLPTLCGQRHLEMILMQHGYEPFNMEEKDKDKEKDKENEKKYFLSFHDGNLGKWPMLFAIATKKDPMISVLLLPNDLLHHFESTWSFRNVRYVHVMEPPRHIGLWQRWQRAFLDHIDLAFDERHTLFRIYIAAIQGDEPMLTQDVLQWQHFQNEEKAIMEWIGQFCRDP